MPDESRTSASSAREKAAERDPRHPTAPPRREDASTDGDHPPRKRKTWRQRPLLMGGLALAAIVIAVGGALWWRHSRNYEKTDDAFVDVTAQRVAAQVPGRVVRVLVNDNQDVRAGDVLVELDPADFQARVDQAQAGAAQAEAQRAEAEAQQAVVEAQREQARAGEEVAAANATNAANDLRRFRELRAASAGAVSPQQLDRAAAAAASSAAQLEAAHKSAAAADAQVRHAARQIEAAQAAGKSAAAQVAQAELMLSYARIKAAVDGRVARNTVAPGNYVQPGADLMAIVPRAVHVTANFKETQLKAVRPGQAVKIKVDSFPALQLTGRIDSVQPASGQVFDLLPSQNAAGNWVKVVQRVPVKITLDQLPADPAVWLAPGMSVEVTVTVRP